jgi:foldase protein PrsA
MLKILKPIAMLGAGVACAGCIAACGGGIASDALVQVNGQPITKADFHHWLGVVAAAGSASAGQTGAKPVIPEPPAYTACIAHLQAIEPKPAKGQKAKTPAALKAECEQQYKSYQQEVLGFLIGIDWLFGEAESQGIKLTDKEVVKHFNELQKQEFAKPGSFQAFLKSTGETVPDLLLRVKQSMIETKLREKISKPKTATEAEVAKYYAEHKSQYGQFEKRDLRIVLTKTEAAANQAKSEIQSGKSFASVAKSKSIDPTSKDNGGELPGVIKGEEQKALGEAVFAAKQGVLTGPVKTPFGYYVFEVKAIHAPTQQPLSQVKTTIKQQLSSQGAQKALEKFSKEFEKKWRAKTECRAGYVVKNCKEYKAPKGSSTTGAAGAAGTAGTE